MSDTIKEANWLRFYYASDDAVKDKDFLKDEAHIKYSRKVNSLMTVPFLVQLWQIKLSGHEEKLAIYKRVRLIKFVTFAGAMALGAFETLNMRKQWLYYDRFYPEATELQKNLYRDAMMFKEQNYQATSVQEKMLKVEDPEVR